MMADSTRTCNTLPEQCHSDADQIRTRVLNRDEHLETSIYRLKVGWSVHFLVGPSLFGEKIHVYVNLPEDSSQQFYRKKYQEVSWQSYSSNKADDTAAYARIKLFMPGGFHYYFTDDSDEESLGSGYFLVDPVLTVGHDERHLSLDSIQCLTVMAKLLGPFNEWESRLRVAKETGYNMIHFTPVQALGGSLSGYSIQDQLKLNPMFNDGNEYSYKDVETLVKKLHDDWKILSVTDVVLNHTANESSWIKEHPESTYNLCNTPHLRPAYLLDSVLNHFSQQIADGLWSGSGLPPEITEEHHLNGIRDALEGYFLPRVKIHEFYTVDVDLLVDEFKKSICDKSVSNRRGNGNLTETLTVIQDPEYKRLASTVDMDVAVQLFNSKFSCHDDSQRENECCESFKNELLKLNLKITNEVNDHLTAAVQNVLHCVKYQRLQHDGPKIKCVSSDHPLVSRYFLEPSRTKSIEEDEELMTGDRCRFIMAHNGWVMNDDPLRNFAERGSNVYLRRDLIAWGDSVKMRYGSKPDDSPFLWEHMKKYVEDMSRIFHGIRLDNCHSTPIEVAEYLIDAGRRIRPNLYVFGELFTSNERTDNLFVNRLGINSLIREAMSAHDSREEGRLIYRYGGDPVGSFIQPPVRPLKPSIAHALFLDQTHDNMSPIQVRSVYDLLPSTALVSMACCATGSNRGYDELVPHHIHVVNESRFYTKWSDSGDLDVSEVNLSSGIVSAKKALNRLHFELGADGYNEVYVDQLNEDIVAVTRHCPKTRQSVILVSHTSFRHPSENFEPHSSPLCVPGVVEQIIMEARLVEKFDGSSYVKNEKFVNGMPQYEIKMKEFISPGESEMIKILDNRDGQGSTTRVQFVDFNPGSVVALRVKLNPTSSQAITDLYQYASQFGVDGENVDNGLTCPNDATRSQDFKSIVSRLSLGDLNRVLFRCDNEEIDEGRGGGVYTIPGFGQLTYCGLQGIMSVLSNIHLMNDVGHPLCENLRAGDWYCDYTSKRLIDHPDTKQLGEWFEICFKSLSQMPRYLIPCYFDTLVTGAYSALIDQIWKQMSNFVRDGSTFIKMLAMGSVQMGGVVNSAPLPALCLSENEPNSNKDESCHRVVTLSAGLPHFSTGCMRNWGRDTFISLKGLFLLTGRHKEARTIILSYGGCLRHGLIPNLLDGGRSARFNCRDAVWWWLQCLQDYCNFVPRGYEILQDKVSRLFPDDESEVQEPGVHVQPLYDIIQEVLQRHVDGVHYTERNAGPQLDSEMGEHGFNNCIDVDPTTGFVTGGNENNCGTWMDKMGSSFKAGNQGKPSTPRNGSAIELVGLCRSTLRWLLKMYQNGHYPYNSVERTEEGNLALFTFEEWESEIDENFERMFWIDESSERSSSSSYEPKPELINRRGIYKDSYGALPFWADYQLRPNFAVSMVVAPEMFDPKHAWTALSTAQKVLLGPLGMKTLDPSDWSYHGYYDNSDDTCDPKTSRGCNYHQGPEWLWPVGYFLRAKLIFAPLVGGDRELKRTVKFVKSVLSKHYEMIQTTPWRGLPELTNKDGTPCKDSCPVQAWSHATLLEVLHDLNPSKPTTLD